MDLTDSDSTLDSDLEDIPIALPRESSLASIKRPGSSSDKIGSIGFKLNLPVQKVVTIDDGANPFESQSNRPEPGMFSSAQNQSVRASNFDPLKTPRCPPLSFKDIRTPRDISSSAGASSVFANPPLTARGLKPPRLHLSNPASASPVLKSQPFETVQDSPSNVGKVSVELISTAFAIQPNDAQHLRGSVEDLLAVVRSRTSASLGISPDELEFFEIRRLDTSSVLPGCCDHIGVKVKNSTFSLSSLEDLLAKEKNHSQLLAIVSNLQQDYGKAMAKISEHVSSSAEREADLQSLREDLQSKEREAERLREQLQRCEEQRHLLFRTMQALRREFEDIRLQCDPHGAASTSGLSLPPRLQSPSGQSARSIAGVLPLPITVSSLPHAHSRNQSPRVPWSQATTPVGSSLPPSSPKTVTPGISLSAATSANVSVFAGAAAVPALSLTTASTQSNVAEGTTGLGKGVVNATVASVVASGTSGNSSTASGGGTLSIRESLGSGASSTVTSTDTANGIATEMGAPPQTPRGERNSRIPTMAMTKTHNGGAPTPSSRDSSFSSTTLSQGSDSGLFTASSASTGTVLKASGCGPTAPPYNAVSSPSGPSVPRLKLSSGIFGGGAQMQSEALEPPSGRKRERNASGSSPKLPLTTSLPAPLALASTDASVKDGEGTGIRCLVEDGSAAKPIASSITQLSLDFTRLKTPQYEQLSDDLLK